MSAGGGYLGLFQRKDESDPSKPLLEYPEIITDASEIYSVGTFAQIQRMTKADEEGHIHPFDEPKDDEEKEYKGKTGQKKEEQ